MRRSTARLQILPWNLGPLQGDLQSKLISGRCWFHPSQFHVAEAYQRAVLFNKDTFEEEEHRLHSLVCSCAKRLRVGTRRSGCSGTVPVDTTPHRTHILLTPSAFYAASLFLLVKIDTSYQASGNRCEACAVPHMDAQCLAQAVAKAQGFVSRSFVRPFRKSFFHLMCCLVTSVPLLSAPHLLLQYQSHPHHRPRISSTTTLVGTQSTHCATPLVSALSASWGDTIHDTVPETSGGRP